MLLITAATVWVALLIGALEYSRWVLLRRIRQDKEELDQLLAILRDEP
jgi:hypothetical protein